MSSTRNQDLGPRDQENLPRASVDSKTFGAARFAFPSTQSGCRAKHNAGLNSSRTRRKNPANRATDNARARATPADPELQSNPRARLRSADSRRLCRAEPQRFASTPSLRPQRNQADRKAAQKSAHSQSGL